MSISDFQIAKLALGTGVTGASHIFWKKNLCYYLHFWLKIGFHT